MSPSIRNITTEVTESMSDLSIRTERQAASLNAMGKDDSARRLTAIPGVGPIIAATIRAVVPDVAGFRAGRDFAAWIGLAKRVLTASE